MYDGKRSTAENFCDALDKIKSKNNEDPLKYLTQQSAM